MASPPFPILRVVPRKNASSILALVMWVFSQECFDFLLDVLCEGVAPTDSYHPIIRISEVIYPDEIRTVYPLGRGVSQLFNGQFEFLGSCFSLSYQRAFLRL